MNISPRTLLAVLGGVIVMIFVAIGAAFVTGGGNRPTDIAQLPPDVVADRTAPTANNDPMVPVTQDEASRRSTLHKELEQSQVEAAANAPTTQVVVAEDGTETTAPVSTTATTAASSYIAPPVVTEVRSSDAEDDLTRALFDQNAEFVVTPDPRADTGTDPEVGDPLPVKVVEPEPEPEEPEAVVVQVPVTTPEPTVAVEAAPLVDPYAPYRDQLRERMKPYGYGNLYDYGIQNVAPPKGQKQSFLGLLMSAFVGTAHAGGYVAPITDAPPIVVPYYDGGRLRIGLEDLYGPPLPHERSAARPELVGHNPMGGAYATQEYHSQRMVSQSGGRQVLARAGDIVFARLLYGFNSDDTRGLPIYAKVTDIMQNGDFGPLHDARIEGVIAYTDHQATASFTRILLADGRDIPMTGIAISDDAARTGFAEKVNRHVLQRYSALFLGGLMEGVGSIAEARYGPDSTPETIVVGDGSTVVIDRKDGELTDKQLLYGAVGPIGRNLGEIAMRGFDRPPTISAPAGHIFGVVFVQTLVFDPIAVEGVPAYNPRTGGMADAAFMQTVGGNPAAPPTAVPAPAQPYAVPADQALVGQPMATADYPQVYPTYPPQAAYPAAVPAPTPVSTATPFGVPATVSVPAAPVPVAVDPAMMPVQSGVLSPAGGAVGSIYEATQ